MAKKHRLSRIPTKRSRNLGKNTYAPPVAAPLTMTSNYPHTLAQKPLQELPKSHRFRELLKRTVLSLLVVAVVIGSWLSWKFYQNAVKVTHNKNPLSLLSIFRPQPLKGEEQGRVNILVAGDSADDPGHAGAQLTDSIMILSLNTQNHTAFILSIPRDTWVKLPGWDHEKINAANEVTSFNQAGFPSGGMGELEEVVQQDLGIQIDYYALISYTAFKDSVNAVGGIDVNIQSSDSRGLYDPSIDYTTNGLLVNLTNGVHHLNGEQALDLARARGDSYGSYGFALSDFDRTQHQRQMLLAIRSKVTSAGVLSNPLKIAQLADAIGNNVKTDLPLSGVERLYSLTKNLNNSNIQSLGLNKINGQTLLKSYYAPDGESALIPTAGLDNFTQIQTVLQSLLTTGQQ